MPFKDEITSKSKYNRSKLIFDTPSEERRKYIESQKEQEKVNSKPAAKLSKIEIATLGRRYAPGWLRKQILWRDSYHCRYCGKIVTNLTANMDHIVSWPLGMTEYTNLVSACRDCNREKGRDEPTVWRQKIKRITKKYNLRKLDQRPLLLDRVHSTAAWNNPV